MTNADNDFEVKGDHTHVSVREAVRADDRHRGASPPDVLPVAEAVVEATGEPVIKAVVALVTLVGIAALVPDLRYIVLPAIVAIVAWLRSQVTPVN